MPMFCLQNPGARKVWATFSGVAVKTVEKELGEIKFDDKPLKFLLANRNLEPVSRRCCALYYPLIAPQSYWRCVDDLPSTYRLCCLHRSALAKPVFWWPLTRSSQKRSSVCWMRSAS